MSENGKIITENVKSCSFELLRKIQNVILGSTNSSKCQVCFNKLKIMSNEVPKTPNFVNVFFRVFLQARRLSFWRVLFPGQTSQTNGQ